MITKDIHGHDLDLLSRVNEITLLLILTLQKLKV